MLQGGYGREAKRNPILFWMVLLMVQKSGDHHLRLVVYRNVYLSFIHPNGGDLGFLVAIKTISVESSHDFPTPHCVGSGPTETCG